MKRKILLCITIIMTCMMFASCGEEDITVYIGTQNLTSPQTIARAENWFSEEMGCNVEIVKYADGLEISKAMKSGQVDFGMIGSVPAAKFISQGMDCKVICIQSILGDIETLAVRQGSGISKAEDLKGKTIATLLSSTAHYSLLKYLDINGIPHDEVNIVHMMVADIASAFERGDIDGAFIWEPELTKLMQNGGKKLVSAKEIADSGYATLDLELARTEFCEEHPELVEKYVACVDKAVKLYNEDPKKACESMAKVLKITPEDSLTRIKSTSWLTAKEQADSDWFSSGRLADTLYDTAKFLFEQKDIDSLPDEQVFKDAVDNEFLNSFK